MIDIAGALSNHTLELEPVMKYAAWLLALPLFLVPQTRQPVIAIGGISHESNSFSPLKTELSDFDRGFEGEKELPPEEFLRRSEKASNTVSGYIEGARLHPTLFASATPSGPVSDQAFNTLVGELIRRIKAGPKPDGVLLALHGAMVVESYPSGDFEIVRRVREAVGKNTPIVVNHDFHANVVPEMMAQCDALITYKENPHIDARERGVQAAEIMAGMMSGKVKAVQAIAKPPMMLNIVFQYTKAAPLLPIVEESRRLEKNPKVLAASVSGGYQYADVPQMGPSVIVVTNNDRELAEREAKRLSDMLWGIRDKLAFNLPNEAAAVKEAMAAKKFPVALMDMGDNIGGGGSGDSTFILRELLAQKAQGWVVTIADRAANEAAFKAGVGQPFDMAVGGKTDKLHGDPVRVRGRVKSLHDGRYIETEVRHGGGRYYDMGLTSVIEAEGSTRDLPNLLLLTTRRTSPNSIHQLVSNGVYPERQRILVAKGSIAPRAAYEPIAALIINVDSGGATAVNPARVTYKRVRRPLFGLNP